MKRSISTVVTILVFLLGLGILLYPTISDWINQQANNVIVSDYTNVVSSRSVDEDALEFEQARRYNATLSGTADSLADAAISEVENPSYWDSLNIVNDIMGVVEIPSIDVSLAIYHGTDETVLQKGVGHLEGSALPTGALGEHSVLTGHTGLPTAKLFTDLDTLVIGDTFSLTVLNQIFTYEVRDIFVVLPSEVENLSAQEDANLVTLVTCTPYGVNSHRLLVQGELIATEIIEYQENQSAGLIDSSSTRDNDTLALWELIPLAVLFVVAALTIFISRKRKKATTAALDQSCHPQDQETTSQSQQETEE